MAAIDRVSPRFQGHQSQGRSVGQGCAVSGLEGISLMMLGLTPMIMKITRMMIMFNASIRDASDLMCDTSPSLAADEAVGSEVPADGSEVPAASADGRRNSWKSEAFTSPELRRS